MIFDVSNLFESQAQDRGSDGGSRVSTIGTAVPGTGAGADLLGMNPDLVKKAVAVQVSDSHFVADFDIGQDWDLAAIAGKVPAGTYRLDGHSPAPMQLASWALGQYKFKAYEGSAVVDGAQKKLVVTDEADLRKAKAIAQSIWLVRDMVNQPANLMGPSEIEAYCCHVAEQHGAEIAVTEDGDVIERDFPAVHAVGRAATADRQPKVIDLTWGTRGPQICLIGKGVCYDTGGLNLKPGNFMRNMKKDMGGAAHALGLANLIMSLGLPVRLRCIIGAVENSVSSNSFRPGDVIQTRKGLSVEIGNTDAEGRLVLADCLALAQEGQAPELMLNFATLTGAARVALGTAMPAVFSNQQALADKLVQLSFEQHDPMWSLPLYRPYAKRLKSQVADLGNIAEGERYGDAIMAALFLDAFVEEKVPWLHVDCFAWNNDAKPGRPKGGEAQGILAALALVEDRLTKGA